MNDGLGFIEKLSYLTQVFTNRKAQTRALSMTSGDNLDYDYLCLKQYFLIFQVLIGLFPIFLYTKVGLRV